MEPGRTCAARRRRCSGETETWLFLRKSRGEGCVACIAEVWQSASPQRGLASWLLFWQIRSTFRICLKYCSLLCAAARRTDCPVASLLAIITCFHTTINENVIYWRYGRSLMSYPRSGRRILQPFQFGKEDQLLSEKTTKSRLAAPNICYGLRHNPAQKTRPGSGSIACALFRKVPTLFS